MVALFANAGTRLARFARAFLFLLLRHDGGRYRWRFSRLPPLRYRNIPRPIDRARSGLFIGDLSSVVTARLATITRDVIEAGVQTVLFQFQ